MSTNNKNINLQIPRFSNLSGGFKNLPIVFEGKMKDIERWVDLWTLVLEDISMSCKNLKTWRGLIAQHEDHIKKNFSYWNVEFEECTFACEIQIKIDWWMARRLCAGWMFVCWFRHLGNLKISRLSYGSRSWNSCVWSKE